MKRLGFSPRLESLESRYCPAVLDLTGGVLTFAGDATADGVFLTISGSTYTVSDPGHTFTSVPAGWTGAGMDTSTGPNGDVDAIILDPGDGDDVVNIRSTNDPVTVVDGAGNDTVNLSTNAPSNTGTLDGINAAITVNGGTGTDNLIASDYSAGSGNSAVAISASVISGLAPADITYSGTFAKVRAITSNTPGLAETVTISGTSATASLQVDTFAGADTVFVLSTTGPLTLSTGYGNDTISLGECGSLSGLMGALTIDAGSGANSLTLDDSVGGAHAVTVTNTQVQGFAPVVVNYKALGGTLALNLDCSSDVVSTIHISPHSTNTTVNQSGDWMVV